MYDELKNQLKNRNVFSGRTVAIIGLENIVVIDSEEGVLVADINKIQDVIKVAEEIKNRSK